MFLFCLHFGSPNLGPVLGPVLGARILLQMELAASAAFHVEHRSCSANTHALRSACQEAINCQQPWTNRRLAKKKRRQLLFPLPSIMLIATKWTVCEPHQARRRFRPKAAMSNPRFRIPFVSFLFALWRPQFEASFGARFRSQNLTLNGDGGVCSFRPTHVGLLRTLAGGRVGCVGNVLTSAEPKLLLLFSQPYFLPFQAFSSLMPLEHGWPALRLVFAALPNVELVGPLRFALRCRALGRGLLGALSLSGCCMHTSQ